MSLLDALADGEPKNIDTRFVGINELLTLMPEVKVRPSKFANLDCEEVVDDEGNIIIRTTNSDSSRLVFMVTLDGWGTGSDYLEFWTIREICEYTA